MVVVLGSANLEVELPLSEVPIEESLGTTERVACFEGNVVE